MKKNILVVALLLSLIENNYTKAQTCFDGCTFNQIPVGGSPYAITKADFNHDGYMDLACSNSANNTVNVLLNNSNYIFSNPVNYPTGAEPRKIIASDLNGDSYPDLVTVNFTGNSLTILLNDGNGGFSTSTVNTNVNPVSVTSIDLTGDNRPELVYINSDIACVLINNGNGTFTPQTPFFVPSGQPTSIISGKFNSDNFNDVVIACNNGYVFFKIGTGTGTFQTSTPSTICPSSLIDMIALDINNDGKLDFAGAGNSSGFDAYTYLNDGNMNFSTNTILYAGGMLGMDTADFNNDGMVDLISMGGFSRATISLNNGNGTFTRHNSMSVDMMHTSQVLSPSWICAADFNGDGRIDLACPCTSNAINGGRLQIFYNNGSTIFNVYQNLPPNTYVSDMDIGDYDNNGTKDFVIGTGDGYIKYISGLGNLQYSNVVVYPCSNWAQQITTDDFNNDGFKDIAVVGGGFSTFSVFLNNGTGGFLPEVSYPAGFSSPGEIISGDFNNDQHPDVVLLGVNNFELILNNGNGTFSAPIYISIYGGGSAQVIDYNHDGNLDIIYKRTTNFVLALGNGNGGFTYYLSPSNNGNVGNLTCGDYNNDGITDIISQNSSLLGFSLYYGAVNLTFSGPLSFDSAHDVRAFSSYDYNGDGFLDFAASDNASGTVTVYENDHSGGFITHSYITSYGISSTIWEDMNGDGVKDIVTASTNQSSIISIILNTTSQIHSIGPAVTCNSTPVTLVAPQGGNTYLWMPGGSTNDSLVVTNSGTYTCTITNTTNGCSSSSQGFNVTINSIAGPVATLSPPNDSICFGQPGFLMNESPNGGTLTGVGIIGSSFQPIISGPGNFPVTYIYTNAVGCSDTTSINITVLPLPLTSISYAGNDTVCITSNSITLNGNPSGGTFTGNGVTANNFNPTIAGIGTHQLIYTYSTPFGCVSADTTLITVTGPDLLFINASGPLNFCQPGNVILSASPGFVSYSWSNGPSTSQQTITSSGTYSVNAINQYGCTSNCQWPVTVNAYPSPTVIATIASPAQVCAPDSILLIATSGFPAYLWSNGSLSDSNYVNTSGYYSVTVFDTNGCSANSGSLAATVNTPIPAHINSFGIPVFCYGDSILLDAGPGFNNYQWNNGSTSASIYADTTGNIIVTTTDLNNCTTSDSVFISTPLCTSVWPGNANKDTIVNNYDLLPIGVHMGTSGYSRNSISNIWQGYQSLDWANTQANGFNMKFVDCDGDGIVDVSDTTAISLNFGQLDFNPARLNQLPQIEVLPNGYPIHFVSNSNQYYPGDAVSIAIWAGDTGQVFQNLYGLAFDFHFTSGVIVPGSAYIEFNPSFIGDPSIDELSIYRINGTQTSIGLVRFDHQNVSGFGPVAFLHFTLDSNNLSSTTLQLEFDQVVLIDSAGDELNADPINDSIFIIPLITNISSNPNQNSLNAFPNPTNNKCNIQFYTSASGIAKIEVVDMTGRCIYTQTVTVNKGDQSFMLDLSNVASGNYMLSVICPESICHKEIVIMHD